MWQPIETAPKDGTEVLAWREDAGIFLARWTSPEEFCTSDELEALSEADAAQEDWFAADFVQGSRLDDGLVPTHWMPLPDPPTDQSQP